MDSKYFRRLLMESVSRGMVSGNLDLTYDMIEKLYDDYMTDKSRSRGRYNQRDEAEWRLELMVSAKNDGETIKVRDPETKKIVEYSVYDLYVEDLKKMNQIVNKELNNMRVIGGDFFYSEKDLVKSILGNEDFQKVYPMVIYVSKNADRNDTVGIIVESENNYKMFEENEECSDETDMLVKRLIGDVGKEMIVYGSHNEDLVNKMKSTMTLPKNLYVTPNKDYAKRYWSSDEQRVLFGAVVNMNNIKREGDLDWKTNSITKVTQFKILGNV